MDYARLLEVSVSIDGQHFEPVASLPGRNPDTDVSFDPPLRCSAVRLEQKGSDPRFFWAINTLKIWGTFPKRVRSWWEYIRYPGLWLALVACVVVGSGAVLAGRWRRHLAPALSSRAELSTAARRWRAAGIWTTLLFAMLLIGTQQDYGETSGTSSRISQSEKGTTSTCWVRGRRPICTAVLPRSTMVLFRIPWDQSSSTRCTGSWGG